MKEGNVESVTGVIVILAARAWKSLPSHAKIWISIQDLIHLGTQELLKYKHHWRADRGASWSTFAYQCVHQAMLNEIHRYYQPKHLPVPLDEPTVPQTVLYDQFDSYRVLYRECGAELRGWLRFAIGEPVGAEKLEYKPIHTYRHNFLRVMEMADEMRKLSRRYRFTYEDAQALRRFAGDEYIRCQKDRNDVRPLPPDVHRPASGAESLLPG